VFGDVCLSLEVNKPRIETKRLINFKVTNSSSIAKGGSSFGEVDGYTFGDEKALLRTTCVW